MIALPLAFQEVAELHQIAIPQVPIGLDLR
jgi:hypothetical protein